MAGWSFLTNHAHVLVCVAREPGMRMRDIATAVGLTERAATRIVGELERDGYLTRHRLGARNFYEIHAAAQLRHPLEGPHNVGELLSALLTERAAL